MSFPNKEERQKCWDSRDRYWECLDKNGDQNEKCLQIRTLYEASCPSQWVSVHDIYYFICSCIIQSFTHLSVISYMSHIYCKLSSTGEAITFMLNVSGQWESLNSMKTIKTFRLSPKIDLRFLKRK